jgi:hypothetical protein
MRPVQNPGSYADRCFDAPDVGGKPADTVARVGASALFEFEEIA